MRVSSGMDLRSEKAGNRTLDLGLWTLGGGAKMLSLVWGYNLKRLRDVWWCVGSARVEELVKSKCRWFIFDRFSICFWGVRDSRIWWACLEHADMSWVIWPFLRQLMKWDMLIVCSLYILLSTRALGNPWRGWRAMGLVHCFVGRLHVLWLRGPTDFNRVTRVRTCAWGLHKLVFDEVDDWVWKMFIFLLSSCKFLFWRNDLQSIDFGMLEEEDGHQRGQIFVRAFWRLHKRSVWGSGLSCLQHLDISMFEQMFLLIIWGRYILRAETYWYIIWFWHGWPGSCVKSKSQRQGVPQDHWESKHRSF